jgi:hypothetical protein
MTDRELLKVFEKTDTNPFHGPNRDEIWKKMIDMGKPISKEEILRKVKARKNLT